MQNLNHFSSHIQRKNGGKIVVYKKTTVYFEKSSKIIVDSGILELGGGKPCFANNNSLFRLQQDAEILSVGNNTIEYGADVLIKPSGYLSLQGNSYINCNSTIRCHRSVSIGKNVITGTNVSIVDGNEHFLNDVIQFKNVSIGNDVWIGANVHIGGGSIGNGSVIGAGALVTSDIPAKSLAYGIPARVQKEDISWHY